MQRVLIIVPGDPDDGGWCEAAVVGARRVSTRLAIDQTTTRGVSPEQLSHNWDVVIGHSVEFASELAEAAVRFPDTRFVVSDYVGIDPEDPPPANLTYVDWRWDEGAFLAGVLAARLSETGIVAYLGGIPVLTQRRTYGGFVLGCASVSPVTSPLAAFAGSFQDPARGRRMTRALIQEGVDVLFHAADQTGDGAMEEARNCGARVIGFMRADHPLAGPDVGLVESDIEGAVAHILEMKIRGKVTGPVVHFGLESGFQRFRASRTVPNEIRRQLHDVETGLKQGSIRIR